MPVTPVPTFTQKGQVLKQDPQYTRRDAVFFHLGESFLKIKREAEALPYLERLVQEFEQSEFLQEAQKRLELLKSAQAKTSGT